MTQFPELALFIPSMGRLDSQLTWDSIPPSLQEQTFIVCPPDEVSEHYKRNRQAVAHPSECNQIGKVRQWIIENSPSYCIMSDDDHVFFRRNKEDWHLHSCSEQDMLDMFEWLYLELASDFHHVGVSARQGNNRVQESYKDVCRVNNFYGFSVETLLKNNIRFDALELGEDFHVTLSLLRLGYPNRVLYEFCWNQSGSNKQGGCSSYRTAELQDLEMRKLAELHAPFVRLKQKESKSSWEGMKTRTDVIIQWKKAYESARS